MVYATKKRCWAGALKWQPDGKSTVERCSRRATHDGLCWQHDRARRQMVERTRFASKVTG